MITPEMQRNGLNISNWDVPIYRVLSLKRFKEMMAKRKLVLVRPSLWDDPFENFFLQMPVQSPGGEPGTMKEIADNWYGICWTLSPDTDAMWRIYSPKKDGVRISTTIAKLFSAIWKSHKFATLTYLIGVVQYQSRKEIENFLRKTTFMDLAFGGQPHKFAETLCTKRLEFKHEEEVRLLFNDVSKKRRSPKLRLPFDYASVLNDVTLDPRLKPSEFDAAKDELLRLGCTLPIKQSELYKIDKIIIKLGAISWSRSPAL